MSCRTRQGNVCRPSPRPKVHAARGRVLKSSPEFQLVEVEIGESGMESYSAQNQPSVIVGAAQCDASELVAFDPQLSQQIEARHLHNRSFQREQSIRYRGV